MTRECIILARQTRIIEEECGGQIGCLFKLAGAAGFWVLIRLSTNLWPPQQLLSLPYSPLPVRPSYQQQVYLTLSCASPYIFSLFLEILTMKLIFGTIFLFSDPVLARPWSSSAAWSLLLPGRSHDRLRVEILPGYFDLGQWNWPYVVRKVSRMSSGLLSVPRLSLWPVVIATHSI